MANTTFTAVDFPGDGALNRWFYWDNPLSQYPATYIVKHYPRSKLSYYTLLAWGNRGPYYWNAGSPDSYYFMTPYPSLGDGSGGIKFEISVNSGDFTTDDNGHDTSVVFNQCYTSAMSVWSDAQGKHHQHWWDLSRDSTKVITRVEPTTYGQTLPPTPSLMVGWHDFAVNPNEEYCGWIQSIQVYKTNKTLAQIQALMDAPLATIQADPNIWYCNLSLSATDISDKSGKGHNPTWKDATARPGTYKGQIGELDLAAGKNGNYLVTMIQSDLTGSATGVRVANTGTEKINFTLNAAGTTFTKAVNPGDATTYNFPSPIAYTQVVNGRGVSCRQLDRLVNIQVTGS